MGVGGFLQKCTKEGEVLVKICSSRVGGRHWKAAKLKNILVNKIQQHYHYRLSFK